jgi:hypothetical protein
VRALTPEEREELFIKKKLKDKYIQFILPDEHEACVIHFTGETSESWLIYKAYSTPDIKCKKCGWKGNWKDLNVKEQTMDLTGKVSELDLFHPVKKITIEECIKCGSTELKYKDWKHEKVHLIIKGTFADVGAVAEILMGGFFHRFKQLFVVLGLLLKKRVGIKPLRRLGTAMKISQLLTGKVSEDYKED